MKTRRPPLGGNSPSYFFLALFFLMTGGAAVASAEEAEFGSGLELLEVRKIWDEAPHNAFTDLIRFQDRWYCVFREGRKHVSPDGKLRVLTSDNGKSWESAALLTHETGDLRDAKITITPDGQLMLSGAVAYHRPVDGVTHQSLVWFSNNGRDWSEARAVGEANCWLWSPTWREDLVYVVGYCWQPNEPRIRLFASNDGKEWRIVEDKLIPEKADPNEASLVFSAEGPGYCLVRREGDTCSAQLGVAKPPYRDWKWHDLGVRIGGPKMIQLPDGRLLAAVRLMSDEADPRGAYGKAARTSLCWIDAEAGKMTEALTLPSGGDTSYAGMVVHEGVLWVSYYSSHEGKTSIYLAHVAIE